jgi:hypothetical protein
MLPWNIETFREYRRNGHTLPTSIIAGFPLWMMFIVIPLAVGIPLSRLL